MFNIVEITQNYNIVHLGPVPWNHIRFENCIEDDLELSVSIPTNPPENGFYSVSDTIKIFPVKGLGVIGEYDQEIQWLNGPFYNYFDEYVEMYYTPRDKDIDSYKKELKTKVTNNRFIYENKGIIATIQGKSVPIITARGERDLYLQAYQLGSNNISWKFGEEFLVITNEDLGTIVYLGMSYVQAVFDWESSKFLEIDSKTTLEELKQVQVVNSDLE